ncbi:MAG: protein-disulfide reductase DsbD family protein [Porticoccaceae bacterium]
MVKMFNRALLITALLTLHSIASASQSQQITFTTPSPSPEITNSLASTPSFLPVQQAFQVEAHIDGDNLLFNWSIADGYYLYRDRFKAFSLTDGVKLGAIAFEPGVRKWDEFFEADLEVYYQQTNIKIPIQSSSANFVLRLESQGCADAGLCYPPHSYWFEVDLTAGTVAITTAPSSTSEQIARTASATPLWLILLMALSGGLILNLMPCVFPVLSIKVLSFTRSHQSSRELQLHGLAYTLGVVASFMAIAALMLSLRTAGEAIGWGFQLQSPGFVIGLIYLFVAMGLSLSGYLPLGNSLMSLGQSSDLDNSLKSSFLTGVLATTVASPCTAPFMGPALGFAISQPTTLALLVFAFLGLGMALPFIVLTWIPALTAKLPKPGPWMDNLKEFLAFPMYATGIWLLWVVGRQTDINVVIAIVLGLLLLIMGIWLWQLKQVPVRSMATKLATATLIVAAVTSPVLGLKTADSDPQWENYSAQRLAALRGDNQPVFINLTADWCITCLVNERVAFGDAFYQSLKDNDITYLKGDWTHSDPEITKLLNQYNRSGVPLYLVFPSGPGQPEILPQILLESTLLAALDRAI